jgi:hypothetical protein
MTRDYELLFVCYITEQMSERSLQEEFAYDEVFRAWFGRRVKRYIRERA